MGAEVIINPVLASFIDRPYRLAIAQALPRCFKAMYFISMAYWQAAMAIPWSLTPQAKSCIAAASRKK